MGINSKFDGNFKAINLASMADDMMAKVVADHVADRFQPSNRANAAVATTYVPYSVLVGGRTVSGGRGEVFPERQLATALGSSTPLAARASRNVPTITIDWNWDGLDDNAIERALKNLVKIDKTIGKITGAPGRLEQQFLMLMNPVDQSGAIFMMLLKKYARKKYPAFFARLDQARALYRVFRLVRMAAGLLGGGKGDGDADASVLAWIASELRSRSPVQSGTYRDAHALYADGQFLMDAASVSDDTQLPEAEEFSFTNTVPYSRKIEIGKTESGRDFVIQVPGHVYERLAADARKQFPDVKEIIFEMRAVTGGEQTPQRHAKRPHNQPDVRYPSIVVRF